MSSPALAHLAARVSPSRWPSPRAALRRLVWPALVWAARHRPYLQLAARAAEVEGDVIECGVFRGRSLLRMACRFQELAPRKAVFGLDSFDGFPANAVTQLDLNHERTIRQLEGKFRRAGRLIGHIERIAADLDLDVHLRPGPFAETLPALAATRRFAFAHLDCDLYSSYRTCLAQLYPAMSPGGIILFDEYRSSLWPGARRAIDEFLADKPERPERCADPGRPHAKYFIVKQG
ncbi:MAG: TylF/MycF/NovP-related O-methyltransferase [Pirellulaceae bacterium]|nr:TylF/MycF/NovP-related O-methyltransferase [Pirellulaceae bacterium]